jgi:hypothetical protein
MSETAGRTPRTKRHRGLPSLSIRRPVGTVMLTSVVLVLGVFFLRGLPLDLLPSITYPQIRANVTNRGVEPEVLEETVAKRLEASLATTENLVRIETDISEGRVGVNLHFAYGTDIDFALQDASKNLDRARVRAAAGSGSADHLQVRPVAAAHLRRRLLVRPARPRLAARLGRVPAAAAAADHRGRRLRRHLRRPHPRDPGHARPGAAALLRPHRVAGHRGDPAGEPGRRRRPRQRRPPARSSARRPASSRSVEDVRGVLLPVPGGGRIPLAEIATCRTRTASSGSGPGSTACRPCACPCASSRTPTPCASRSRWTSASRT